MPRGPCAVPLFSVRAEHAAYAVTYLHVHFISYERLRSLEAEYPRGVWYVD